VTPAPTTWVASEIRALRLRLGLSRAEFAVRVGVAYHTICSWEQGKSKPDRRNAKALDALREEGT